MWLLSLLEIYGIGFAISIFIGLVITGYHGGEDLELLVHGGMTIYSAVIWPLIVLVYTVRFIVQTPVWIGIGIRKFLDYLKDRF